MVLKNSNHGIVVSTADHFSYQAYRAKNRANEVGMFLELIDRYALDHMLDGVLLDNPWKLPLKQNFPEFIPYLEAIFATSESKCLEAPKLIGMFDPNPTYEEVQAYIKRRDKEAKKHYESRKS